ncbi:MAG: ATP-binding protein [Kiritimatiellae bacterium]|nr:ATP-binding protein [Kiritimatiellia bacterium]
MHIKRDIDAFLAKRMFGGKALVIYGPRQAGKTTAIETYLAENSLVGDTVTFNGDEAADREMLAEASAEKLKLLMGSKRILFIDEAHKVPGIGLVMKRAWDKLKDVQVVASGSSSVELADRIEEPMTGRKFEYTLMPLSFAELAAAASPADEMRQIEHRLVYGSYPDVVAHPGDEVERLRAIGKGYLYKDILSFGEIKRPEVLDKLLRALALQIGQEAVYSELAETAGTDAKTVARYIEVLEKAYIVRKVPSYAKNLRNELKKSKKIYFTDCGIRNYILGDWRTLEMRGSAEAGHMWESYLVSERFKWRLLHEPETCDFFWRTAQQQEVDLVEEASGGLRAFEFKWNPRKGRSAFPKTFLSAYPSASQCVITPSNLMDFLY